MGDQKLKVLDPGAMISYQPHRTAILYQNSTKSVTLLDIPKSILVAQGTVAYPCLEQPHSSPPLREPYPSTEPKSSDGTAKLNRMRGATDSSFPTTLFNEALKEIAECWSGDKCLQRSIGDPDILERKAMQDGEMLEALETPQIWSLSETVKLPLGGVCHGNIASINSTVVCNEHTQTVNLRIASPPAEYRVPPKSCFLLSKITDSTVMSFSMAALQEFPTSSATTTAGPGQFDLIVLDPPWQNHSARRSKQYQMMGSHEHPMDALRGMLAQHIGPSGLVACWITNKAAVRDMALDAFADWQVTLIEEWAWLKVTVDGWPVMDIDSVWRKPYELLLVGQKADTGKILVPESNQVTESTRKRVIVAVPDIHSRKPNLKELIEPMLPDHSAYRALEIFARNLTAGWWAWGDEVLKYNDALSWSGQR